MPTPGSRPWYMILAAAASFVAFYAAREHRGIDIAALGPEHAPTGAAPGDTTATSR